MALVTTEKMLKDAQAGHYAVGAFNVENLVFVMAVLAAAEETKSPVIMQTTPGTIKTAGLVLSKFFTSHRTAARFNVRNVFENREHLRRRNCIAQRFHPLAAVRHLFGQTRDVGGFFGPKGMSVHLRGKPISHSTQSGLR